MSQKQAPAPRLETQQPDRSSRPRTPLRPAQAVVQRKAATELLESIVSETPQNESAIRQAAGQGTSGASGAMPHLERMRAAFYPHDLSRIKAHHDDTAQNSAKLLGAEAYTFGQHAVFRSPPSLFTAAHEAAHAVQQRAGVDVSGGMGKEGDRYEQQADQVAQRVVHGKSAADLLPPADGGSAANSGVQRIKFQALTKKPETLIQGMKNAKIMLELQECLDGLLKSNQQAATAFGANAVNLFRQYSPYKKVKSIHGYDVFLEKGMEEVFEQVFGSSDDYPHVEEPKPFNVSKYKQNVALEDFYKRTNSNKSQLLKQASSTLTMADDALSGSTAVNALKQGGQMGLDFFESLKSDEQQSQDQILKNVKADDLASDSEDEQDHQDELEDAMLDEDDDESASLLSKPKEVFNKQNAKQGAKKLGTKMLKKGAEKSAKKGYQYGLAVLSGGATEIASYVASGANALTNIGNVADYCRAAIQLLHDLQNIQTEVNESGDDQSSDYYDPEIGVPLENALSILMRQSLVNVSKVASDELMGQLPLDSLNGMSDAMPDDFGWVSDVSGMPSFDTETMDDFSSSVNKKQNQGLIEPSLKDEVKKTKYGKKAAKKIQGAKSVFKMDSASKNRVADALYEALHSNSKEMCAIAEGALSRVFGMDSQAANQCADASDLRACIYPKGT